MRNWIAGIMTLLGALLVISGAVAVAVQAATPDEDASDHEHVPVSQPALEIGGAPVSRYVRLLRVTRRMKAADRLIAWGVLLLLLAAVTSGAIAFNVGANAATK